MEVMAAEMEAAVERCLAFTGGSEAAALLTALDHSILLFLSRLSSCLQSLPPICGLSPPPPPTPASSTTPSAPTRASGPGSDRTTNPVSDDPLASLPEPAGYGGSGAGGVEEEEEWAVVQGAVQLLMVAESVAVRVAVFEASLRTALTQLSPRLGLNAGGDGAGEGGGEGAGGEVKRVGSVGGAGGGGGGAGGGGLVEGSEVDVAVLRLAEYPDKAQRLARLLDELRDPRIHALPRTAQRVRSFQEAVSSLVYDVLIAKVRRQLAGVSTMPDWALGEEENVFDLPSFNAYALPYITAVGEYLLTLPQQLEPLAVAASEAAPSLLLQASASGASAGGESATPTAAGEEDAGAYFVREWMTKVADGATSLFVEQIRAIPEVSDRGAQQLAADIEYLYSVLSVLYVAASPAIATFQACFATPKASLAEFIAQESGVGVPSFSLHRLLPLPLLASRVISCHPSVMAATASRGSSPFSRFGDSQSFNVDALKNFSALTPSIQSHLQKVYLTLSLTLVVASLGAYAHVLWGLGGALSSIASIAGFFGSTPRPPFPLTRCALLIYSPSQRVSITPELHINPGLLVTAFVATAAIFLCFSGAALLARRREYLYLGGFLASAVSTMLALRLASIFFGGSNAVFQIELYGGLLVFAGYIIYDTQVLLERARQGHCDHVVDALELLLDFVAVFVRILFIL
ncbi:unnamed protein product, partial [Closterium sp. Yama58-4]